MANTYTQIHIHVVFAVKFRQCLIDPVWKNDLYKFITGFIRAKEHKMLAINGMPDHLHLLFGMRPTQSLSDLIQGVKANSSRWINAGKFFPGRFEWQEGFAAFSYSKSQIGSVISYIHNQEIHHKTFTFLEEYESLLKKFDIKFDTRYLFAPPM